MLYPETGYGALQRSRNLLIELCKYHEVSLICLYRDADKKLAPNLMLAEKDLKKFCKTVCFIPHNLTTVKRGFFIFKSIVTKLPYSVYIYRSDMLNKKILQLALDNTIDLVHSDTIGMLEPILNNIKAIKVLNHHDIESHKMLRRSANEEKIINRIFFRHEYKCIYEYEKIYYKNYDLNIVVSDIDQYRMKEINQNIQATIIENGVDCDYFAFNQREKNSHELIFIGALDYYPNYKAMLFFCNTIWPILKGKYPDLKLTIIGKKPPKQLISLIGSSKSIDMLGYVDDIRPHVKRATVFVCPIKEGGGTRIKILDAMSQGIPVVSTSIGAEGLNIENGNHILIADSIPEFVDGISELIENNELSNRISLQAREYVEKNYSYKYIGEKLATVYKGLSERNRD